MKKLLTLFIVVLAMQGFAQDTTSCRWVGIDPWNSQLVYFNDDYSELGTIASSYGAGHAIYINPIDQKVYVLIDSVGYSGDRDIYLVNPFDGSLSLAYNLADTNYFCTGDISEDGLTFYGIEGNGNSYPGRIDAIDLTTLTQTYLGSLPNVDTSTSTYGMAFYPPDSSLYVYSGSWNGQVDFRLLVVDLDSMNISYDSLHSIGSYQIHGAMWTGIDKQFIVVEDLHYLSISDLNGNNLDTLAYVDSTIQDITEMNIIFDQGDLGFCPNADDSILLHTVYPINTVEWFKDDVPLAETNDSIWIYTPGVYKVLIPLQTGDFMWSEEVVVQQYTVPVVNITQADNDTLICPGDTIALSGASGGTLQWYKDGVMIAGANGNTYGATEAGIYNQMKTNLSGCSDTAAVPFVIGDDPNCGISIFENDNTVNIYPIPVKDVLSIEAKSNLVSVIIYDMSGKEVYRNESIKNNKLNINFDTFDFGAYKIKVKSLDGEVIQTIVK